MQDVTAALNGNLEYLSKLKTVSTLSNEASYNLVGEFAEWVDKRSWILSKGLRQMKKENAAVSSYLTN